MIRRPPRSTHCISSAASVVYKRQHFMELTSSKLYSDLVFTSLPFTPTLPSETALVQNVSATKSKPLVACARLLARITLSPCPVQSCFYGFDACIDFLGSLEFCG
eukprot:TRINITY_DN3291_c0_g1_i3.p1 TRINITY_DN3291_c0_g1~~TRINITY_DN3291_c0_g1_i3.p1  ORF type:complete len:113 (-),score=18.65 TRINITY_DN3291_c0_g1_i3:1138-1452(-)